ncbi:MAG: hypothetical protein JW759_03080 [Candidatus Coatesbacteria bacterium]|nr:hypothetical protein [Candidatus Coatesbacteria bacterium]
MAAHHSAPRTVPVCIWAVLLGAIFLVPYLRPIAVFLLPGLLIHILPGAAPKKPISSLARTIASSIAFWVIGLWAASWTGLNLATLFWVVSPVSAALWLIVVARKAGLPALIPASPVQIAAIIVACVLTMLPLFCTLAPPGADMSMHGYVTRIVFESGGVPDTYEPYLPIKEFGAFSIGFHTLAALTTTISEAAFPLRRALLLMDCLVYFLFFIFLMGALSLRFSSWTAAACASLALFLARSPQHFFAWGGTPTVLSIGLIACALPALKNPRNAHRADVALCAFWLSAAFLCHPLPTIILGVIYLPYAGYLVAMSIKERDLLRLLLRYVAVAAIGFVCTSFFLAKYANGMSQDETEWIRVWDSVVQERWHGTLFDAPITLTRHLTRYSLGFLTLPLGFAMLIAALSGDREDRADLYFVLAIAAVVVNARYQILPKSVYLFPDRADAMLPLFAAPLIGSFLLKIKSALAAVLGEPRVRRLALICLIVVALASCAGAYVHYMRPGLAEAPVTADDLRAFDWIESNTAPGSHIANNYSDAGIWIPMMTRRSVTVPHINIVNWSETKLLLASTPAQYVFLGAKSVYPFPFEWTSARVEALRPTPRLVFQSGEARLYELESSLACSISINYERLIEGKGEIGGEITILSPGRGELLTTPRVMLEWDPSGCDLFNVQLSLCANFDNPLPIYNSYPAMQITSGSCDITSLRPLMPPNTPIYWRIRGLSARGGDLFESQIGQFLGG